MCSGSGFWAVSLLGSPYKDFVRPAKCAVSRGALLLLVRPGSGVSILLKWRLRAIVLVREVVSGLWRDAACARLYVMRGHTCTCFAAGLVHDTG